MGLEGGENIGGVTVTIKGDYSQFAGEVASKTATIAREAKMVIKPTLDTTGLRQEMQRVATAVGGTGLGHNFGGNISTSSNGKAEAAQWAGYLNQWKAIEAQKTQATVREAKARANAEIQEMRRVATAAPGNGGGPGGGGRGMSPYANPFSERGFARLVGSGAAVYGGTEALNLMTGLVDAYHAGDPAHVARRVRDMQTDSMTFSASSDSTLRHSGQASADVDSSLKALQAFEAIPFLGSLVKFTAALDGTSDRLEQSQKEIARATASYVHLREHNEEGMGRLAKIRGDAGTASEEDAKRGMARATTTRETAESDLAAEQRKPLGERDYNKINLLKSVVSESRQAEIDAGREGQFSVDFARLRDANEIKNARAGSALANAQADASARGANGDALGAMRLRHRAEQEASRVKGAGNIAEAQMQYDQAFTAEGAAGHSQDSIDARLRASARLTEAKKKAAADDRALTNKNHAEELAEERKHTDQIIELRAHAAAASLRGQRMEYQASMVEFDAASATMLGAPMDAATRGAMTWERYQQREAMRAGHAREMLRIGFDQTTRLGQAQYQQEMMPEAAAGYASTRAIVDRVASAVPGTRDREKAVAREELKAMQAEMSYRGGGMAENIGAGMMVGDPLDLSHAAAERKARAGDINAATKALDNIAGDPASDTANLKSIADGIVTLIAKFGTLFGVAS